jgi:hypothetical protein
MRRFVDEFMIEPERSFFLEYSSSSDDSNIVDFLFDDDLEQMRVILIVNDLEDRRNKKRQGSTIRHMCITLNSCAWLSNADALLFHRGTYLPTSSISPMISNP